MIFEGDIAPDETLVTREAERVDLRVDGEERTEESAARDSPHFKLVRRQPARGASGVAGHPARRARRTCWRPHAKCGAEGRRASQPESERRDAC